MVALVNLLKELKKQRDDYENITYCHEVFYKGKVQGRYGVGFLSVVNFLLLIVATSEKIQNVIPFRTWFLAMFGLVTVWLFSYFLDKLTPYMQDTQTYFHDRDPQWIEMMRILKKLDAKHDQQPSREV